MTQNTKKLAIVTANAASTGSNLLATTARRLGYKPLVCLADDKNAASIIDAADAVIYRRSPKTVELYKNIAMHLTNRSHKQSLLRSLESFSKCDSYTILSRAHVPMPKSEIVTKVLPPPWLPGVVKAAVGNKGLGVTLVKTIDEYNTAVAKCLDAENECLYQEYIEESRGADKRVIVCGSRYVAAMRRIAQPGEFRANIHLGAAASAYEPSSQEKEIAIAAVDALELPYAGVDIIDSDEGPLVLEVNPSPGYAISEITGVDIAKEIIEHIMNEANA